MLFQLCLLCAAAQSAQVRGLVRDAQTGEPLARVLVEAVESGRRVLTGGDGTFTITDLSAGELNLRLSTVGYRLLQKRMELQPADDIQLEFAHSQDMFQRTDRIEVRADPFALGADAGQFSIEGNDIKDLAGVLADDSLRAVQSMPGVSSNDDFKGRFSLRGAPYKRIGLYLDGVLLHAPFYTVAGEGPSGSMAAFNGDMVDEMSLESSGYPARFGDRTAGVLDIQTREGSRNQTNFRLTASAADAGALAEGPLGEGGSWLASERKSYLQYLVPQIVDQPSMVFGFQDSQAQLSYDLGRTQNVKVSIVDAESSFDRSQSQDQLALNTSMLAGYHFTLAKVGWQYSLHYYLLSVPAVMRIRTWCETLCEKVCVARQPFHELAMEESRVIRPKNNGGRVPRLTTNRLLRSSAVLIP